MARHTRQEKCSNKRQYTTKAEALEALKGFARRKYGGIRINAEVYKCGSHYHWGHYNPRGRR